MPHAWWRRVLGPRPRRILVGRGEELPKFGHALVPLATGYYSGAPAHVNMCEGAKHHENMCTGARVRPLGALGGPCGVPPRLRGVLRVCVRAWVVRARWLQGASALGGLRCGYALKPCLQCGNENPHSL